MAAEVEVPVLLAFPASVELEWHLPLLVLPLIMPVAVVVASALELAALEAVAVYPVVIP
jgi:hypothetical protein